MSVNVEKLVDEIVDIISDLRIVERENYKGVIILETRVKGVKNFRKELFRVEVEEIRKLLESCEVDRINEVRSIVASLDSLRKDGKFISRSSFAKMHIAKVNEILDKKKGSLYALIIERSYLLYKEKLQLVQMASKEVTDSTIFWLFLASFIIATLKEALLQGLSDKQVRDEIVTDFYIDFMYGFSYVEQKAHTVLELKRGAKRIVKKIREAIENSDTLFQRYRLLKDELSFRGFDFDVRMPKP